MKAEERARVRQAMEGGWDDLRERRVLGRVLANHRARPVQLRRRWTRVTASVAVAAAIAISVYSVHALRGAGGEATELGTAEAGHGRGRMALRDGSEAILIDDAHLQIEEQTAGSVQLTQSTGEVMYDVRHDPARSFVVRAGDVRVRVRGTQFSVAVKNGAVDVRVSRGRVEVQSGARIRELVAGESLQVPARRLDTADESVVDAAPPADSPSASQDTDSNPLPQLAPVAQPHHAEARPLAATVDALLADADDARAAGREADAAKALEAIVTRFPRDPRVPSALFTLGRVERARGRFAESAAAFGRCWRAAPKRALAEDAMAEEAESWAFAQRNDDARAAARRYLARYPTGVSAARMRAKLEE